MNSQKQSSPVSLLIAAWSRGDKTALTDLVPIVYPDLRRIARQYLRRQTPDHLLESAALVHEVYLKLVRAEAIHCQGRTHFFAMCAQIIRRILVDEVRQQGYRKRGAHPIRVSFEELALGTSIRAPQLLSLDEALDALFEIDPRKARVVELRYFGGLTIDETAHVLDISSDTVLRDWKFAKVWLLRQMEKR